MGTCQVIKHLNLLLPALFPQVYIHCKLIAWDPDDLNEMKKACNYNKATGE